VLHVILKGYNFTTYSFLALLVKIVVLGKSVVANLVMPQDAKKNSCVRVSQFINSLGIYHAVLVLQRRDKVLSRTLGI